MAKKKQQDKGTRQEMEKPTLSDEELEALDAISSQLEAVSDEEAAEEAADAAVAAEAVGQTEAEGQTGRNELEEALNEALEKQEEYLNMAQRVQADFENFRRRNQNVRKEAFDDGASAFIITLLPVVDNLERAIESARDSADPSLREGVEMVYRQLCETFAKRGVSAISRLGEKFDPNLENAVMQADPEAGEPGTVCEVMQKGYQMGDAILRYAMVKVVPE